MDLICFDWNTSPLRHHGTFLGVWLLGLYDGVTVGLSDGVGDVLGEIVGGDVPNEMVGVGVGEMVGDVVGENVGEGDVLDEMGNTTGTPRGREKAGQQLISGRQIHSVVLRLV